MGGGGHRQQEAAGSDVVRSMAERAGAAITEIDGSHVIMVSQPKAVTDVILRAVAHQPVTHPVGGNAAEGFRH